MIYIYPNTTSTFTGDRDISLSNGYIEIDDATYADLEEGKKKWQNGAIVDDPTYPERKAQEEAEAMRAQRISALKAWFDSEYREYNEKLTRFSSLGLTETVHDEVRGKDYASLLDLYEEAERVRSEIRSA